MANAERDALQASGLFPAAPIQATSPSGIEKDFWGCWILRELFRLPGIGEHLTFKGGTSLSKGWGLIQRSSSDIDVVISRAFLAYNATYATQTAESNKDVRLVPAREQLASWKQGYRAMQDVFFGEAPDFNEVLRLVAEFENCFNQRWAPPHSSA